MELRTSVESSAHLNPPSGLPAPAPAKARSHWRGSPQWALVLALVFAATSAAGCVRLPKEPERDIGHRPSEIRRDETRPAAPADERTLDWAREDAPSSSPTSTAPPRAEPDYPRPAPAVDAAPTTPIEGLAPAPERDTPAELVVGQFPLSRTRPIIDGDTIRVDGLDATLRLLSIDTEEHYRSEADRQAAEMDFHAYARAKQADSPYPVSYGTPMAYEATRFAERFFEGHATVLLEYDHPQRRRGYFSRHLVYVFVVKDGEWVNYNLETVRQGMSPYYTKYGYSSRFHEEFVEAQEEAMNERRGIWAPGALAYPDYDVRLAWWKHRADMLSRFHRLYGDNPLYVEVGADDAMERLLALEGQVVTVFGAVSKERPREDPPFIIPIQHRRGTDFAIVAFEREDLDRLALHRYTGEYAYLRGRVTTYRGSPQMLARNVERVWTE